MLETMPLPVQDLVAYLIEKKKSMVFDNGIGSEISPQVVSFDSQNKLIGRAEMQIGVESHFEQYENLLHVAALMRSGWHASSVALCMEGFMALRLKEKRPETSLAELFASNDKNVLECFTVVWHSENGESALYSVPFKIGFGRSVDILLDEGRGVQNAIVGPYQDGLQRMFEDVTLAKQTDGIPKELYLCSVALMINRNGFDVDSPMLSDLTNWIEKNKHKYEI
jgi:hypothetical protein